MTPQRSELCRIMDLNFAEFYFPRTPVNKGKAEDWDMMYQSSHSTSKRHRVRTRCLFASSVSSRVRPT